MRARTVPRQRWKSRQRRADWVHNEIRHRPPLADPDVAARKLIEIASGIDPMQDGRIFIERINAPFLYQFKGTPMEYKAGLERAIARGWLWLHESGTYVRFTEAGAAPFA